VEVVAGHELEGRVALRVALLQACCRPVPKVMEGARPVLSTCGCRTEWSR
jgi:hypothetical protein